jgi:protein O-GlcNAc transferase
MQTNEWDEYELHTANLLNAVRIYLKNATHFDFHPFHMLTLPEITPYELLLSCIVHSRHQIKDLMPALPPPTEADKDKNRKIRVGFLSSDFKNHPVGTAFKNFPQHFHDERLEVYCLSTTYSPDDGVQQHIKSVCSCAVCAVWTVRAVPAVRCLRAE